MSCCFCPSLSRWAFWLQTDLGCLINKLAQLQCQILALFNGGDVQKKSINLVGGGSSLRGTCPISIQELQDPKQAAVDDSVKKENLG